MREPRPAIDARLAFLMLVVAVVIGGVTPATALEVTLGEPPARTYGDHSATDDDARFAKLIERLTDVVYDPALGHAARELARFQATHRAVAPTEVVRFFLDAAGAIAYDTRQSMISTTERGLEPAIAVVRQMRDQRPVGVLRVGVGEVRDGRGRSIAVITTAGPTPFESFPRRVRAGDSVRLEGKLPPGMTEPVIEVLTPGLELKLLSLELARGGFSGLLKTGPEPGHYRIELSGRTDHDGERRVLAQLPLYASVELPTSLIAGAAAAEGHTSVVDAERAARALLDADRAQAGVDPLTYDSKLAAMARAHSDDMLATALVTHESPTRGDFETRAARAGVSAVLLAENVAQNVTIREAQSSLMLSIGHRRNILDPRMTHVGIGVARAADSWYVTQVFARRARHRTPVDTRTALLATLNRRRQGAGAASLVEVPELTGAATRLAARHKVSAADVLAEATAGRDGRATAVVQQMSELEQFDPSDRCLSPSYLHVGVGIAQRDGPNSSLTIVLILTD